MKLLTAILGAIALSQQAIAGDFIDVEGRLSDQDFYRLVACAAPPGGACAHPFVRWSQKDAREVTVAIVKVDDRYPERLRSRIESAFGPSLDALNSVGAGIRFAAAEAGSKPDIRIFLLDLSRFSMIKGTGVPMLDGQPLQGARFQLSARDDGTIIECAIAFSRDLRLSMILSTLLEEIAQCSGLMTDIGGTYYQPLSIFSERGEANTLGDQDIRALRRHYP